MITPDSLAKCGTEHGTQVAFFAYVAVAARFGFSAADLWTKTGSVGPCPPYGIPELGWVHAIPNGGARGNNVRDREVRGGQLKAEGVRSGVADVFCPVPSQGLHGLYIEFKKPALKPKREAPPLSHGSLSAEQAAFGAFCIAQGYGWALCYTWSEAVVALKQYLNMR